MLYYSHVNEDNRVEKNLLLATGCTTIVAVAGSGERVIALLDDDRCTHVHVVDVNEEALFLLQLKLAALEELSIEDYLGFCGYAGSTKLNRMAWYNKLTNKLTLPCKMYWDSNITIVKNGIAGAGHFEKFLQRIRPVINNFLGKGFQAAFTGNPVSSIKFPQTRWKLLSYFFSRRWVYKLLGNKDAAFTSKDAAISHIPSALNEIIYKGEAGSCFMAHLIFKGSLQEMNEADLPPSLQKNVLQKIKERLNASTITIHYHHTDILDYSQKIQASSGKPVFYSVSDILSFETNDYMRQLISKTALPGNTIIWRTFLRNRNNGNANTWFSDNGFTVEEQSNKESTRMYQVFSVKKKHA